MIFLTPGEKIKRTRVELGIKQRQLCSADISRNFISMVEGNKRGLSRETAEKLIEEFKKIAAELGKNVNLDLESLLYEPNKQAREYCTKFIKSKNYDIDELISIAKQYELKDLIYDLSIIKADNLYNENRFLNSFIYYLDAVNLTYSLQRESNQAFLYNKLGKCKLCLMLYKEAMFYFQRALDFSIEYNDLITRKNVMYNLALSYFNNENFEDSLELVNKYLEICDYQSNRDEYINASILKSNCYMNIGKYNEVIDLYFSLLVFLKDEKSTMLGYIYNNLGLVYMKINDFERSIEHFGKAEDIRTKIDLKTLSHTLIDKSKLYYQLSEFSKAIETIERGIELAKEYNDLIYTYDGLMLLKRIYERLGDSAKLREVYCKVIGLLETSDDKYKLMASRVSLSLLYLESGNLEQCKNTLMEAVKTKD
jgi:HTH-type transcriptional regulator, quorum sensing regulator NprR